MNGGVDEVRIWSTARTSAQIAAFREFELPYSIISESLPARNIVAYYKLNEAKGVAMVTDSVVSPLSKLCL